MVKMAEQRRLGKSSSKASGAVRLHCCRGRNGGGGRECLSSVSTIFEGLQPVLRRQQAEEMTVHPTENEIKLEPTATCLSVATVARWMSEMRRLDL